MKFKYQYIIIFFSLVLISCVRKNDRTVDKNIPTTNIEFNDKQCLETIDFILKENSIGNFELKRGILIKDTHVENAFSNIKTSKHIGQQDGPNFYYYNLEDLIRINTNNTIDQLLESVYVYSPCIKDYFKVKIGMTYNQIIKLRPYMNLITEHSHIYLTQDDSHIIYEMSIPNFDGPDKNQYTIEDIDSSRIIAIIWKQL